MYMMEVSLMSEFCNKDNQFGVYNNVVKGVVLINRDNFFQDIITINNTNDSEYHKFGGKLGFVKYLEKHLRKEDGYFKKFPQEISFLNQRYQDFCDDMVLYEVVRYTWGIGLMGILPLDELNKFTNQLNNLIADSRSRNETFSLH